MQRPPKNKDLAELVSGFDDLSVDDAGDKNEELNIDEVKNESDAVQDDKKPNEEENSGLGIDFETLISQIQSPGGVSPEIQALLRAMGIQMPSGPALPKEARDAVLGGNPTLEAICAKLKAGKYKNVIIMSGAGLSTAAGIPDFRSPVKGLYATIAKTYKSLSQPEDVFTLSFFRRNPEPFWRLCRELDLFGTKSTYKPTPAHYLSKLLDDKGILLRTFTQNIDSLDRRTGLREEKLLEAHGSAYGAYCIQCGKDQPLERVQAEVDKEKTPHCFSKDCNGLVKPKITFFGEAMPKRFHSLTRTDFPKCDLLIVMGTSLAVAPFCHLISDVSQKTPRLLINLGDVMNTDFEFDRPENYRDVFEKTTCDKGVQRLVDLCGWSEEFKKILDGGPVKGAKPEVEEVKEEVKVDDNMGYE